MKSEDPTERRLDVNGTPVAVGDRVRILNDINPIVNPLSYVTYSITHIGHTWPDAVHLQAIENPERPYRVLRSKELELVGSAREILERRGVIHHGGTPKR